MSSNIVYTSIPQILTSCTTLEAQLALMDLILNNMLIAINTATTTGQFSEYTLDTGQTKSMVKYSSLTELQKSFDTMFKTKQMVLAQLNYNKTGRVAQIVPAKNFTGYPGGGGTYYG